MRRVYAIAFQSYTYTPGAGGDWQLTTEETKNVMADNCLAAVDTLRACPSNNARRIEIQSIQHICTVDLISVKN